MRSQRSPLTTKRIVIQAILLLLGTTASVMAQSSTVGSISGTVRDPQGAIVAKTEVTIQEETTGLSRTVKTNEDGIYSAQSLTAGRYTVSASPQGFKKTMANGVELHIGENLVINLTLEVGQVTESVTVVADNVQVETQKGDVSSLIAEKQVKELPLNGRNYAQLALLV